MTTVAQRFGFLSARPAGGCASPHHAAQPADRPVAPPAARWGADAALLTSVRPASAATMSPDVRRELDALRAELAQLNIRLAGALRQVEANSQAGCCPACGPNCTCCKPGSQPGDACCPTRPVGPAAWFPPAPVGPQRPAWCTPGDPSCDPAARFPAFIQPHWCNPYDPAHAGHAHAPTVRPHWCNPADPSCAPHANPSVIRPHWCDPASPGCAGHATPSVLAPHWCNPTDPGCAPHYVRPAFLGQ